MRASQNPVLIPGDAIQKGPCRLEAKGTTLAVPTWLGQQCNPGEKAVPGFGVVRSAHRWTMAPKLLALWVRVTQKRGAHAQQGVGVSLCHH